MATSWSDHVNQSDTSVTTRLCKTPLVVQVMQVMQYKLLTYIMLNNHGRAQTCMLVRSRTEETNLAVFCFCLSSCCPSSHLRKAHSHAVLQIGVPQRDLNNVQDRVRLGSNLLKRSISATVFVQGHKHVLHAAESYSMTAW